MEQKRHAILQSYVTMYLVLIVYYHMLQRMMLTMFFFFFFFFLTACVKMYKAAHVLYLNVAHNIAHATNALNVIAFWNSPI